MNLDGAQIAAKLYQHSAFLWEEVLGGSGPLLEYYEKEWVHESPLYTSIFRLALVQASRDFGVGAINEYSDIDVVWVSRLPLPAPKSGSSQWQVDDGSLILLAEVEMQHNEIQAIERLFTLDEKLRKKGFEEPWKVLITYRPVADFQRSIPPKVRSPDQKKWLVITEAPLATQGVWLRYHAGPDAFFAKPVALGP